ncbi:MAG: hypothetical protein QMD92_08170 [bacterium]|nr:hypothetical protein [bacterium]
MKEICIMESDGKNPVVIRKAQGFDLSDYAGSPDGRKIAFIEDDIEKIYRCEQIHIIDYQKKNELVLTDDSLSCSQLSWSPNGKWIAFSANSPKMGYLIRDIYIMKSNGRNKVKIASTTPNQSSFPVWSPDGKNIAFLSYPDYDPKIYLPPQLNCDIYIVNVETKNLTQLTENLTYDGDISWFPDGRKIVYSSWQGNYEIFVIDIETKKEMQLTSNSVDDVCPIWSLDGKKIAFISDGMLYLMDPDGKNQVKLTDKTQCYVSYGVWSPDSKKLAFVAEGDIYTIDIDGKNLKNLTNTPDWDESCPSWRPIAK